MPVVAGPLSLNSTGDDMATPHGASLRTVPAPEFHVSVSVSGVAAPEPSTWILMLAGFGGSGAEVQYL